jgi:hypothetical protein
MGLVEALEAYYLGMWISGGFIHYTHRKPPNKYTTHAIKGYFSITLGAHPLQEYMH